MMMLSLNDLIFNSVSLFLFVCHVDNTIPHHSYGWQKYDIDPCVGI